MSVKTKNVKIDKNSKAFKFYEAKKAGKTKKEAALSAGYSLSTATQPQAIERTQDYQIVERHFKDEMLAKITLSEIADELTKNIKQDSQLGAKNEAIKIALSKIEPDDIPQDSESVLVILK